MHKGRIGFDRELNLSWLDLTAGLVQEGLDVDQTRQELTTRLANEIPGKEACRKTVTVLTRIWSRVPQEHQIGFGCTGGCPCWRTPFSTTWQAR
jgi:hypothetical protein